MKCRQCMGFTKVYETRTRRDGAVARRRFCLSPSCGHKFITLEDVTLPVRMRRGTGSPLRRSWAPKALPENATQAQVDPSPSNES